MKQFITQTYKKLPFWLKKRYFLSFILFFIWIFFFDANSIETQIKNAQEIKKIKADINYYKNEINHDKKILNIISPDSLTPELEKYYRENLFLSKKNEEIFIIESK